MVKLMVLYGKPEDPSAFDAHYAATHAPLAAKIPNLRRYEHGKALGSADGSEAPFYYVADLSFDDPEALQAGMSSPEGEAAAGDLANFASGGVTMFVAQV
ncbi:MAG: EthD family reductase [Solirubrobacteraceae bacterium]